MLMNAHENYNLYAMDKLGKFQSFWIVIGLSRSALCWFTQNNWNVITSVTKQQRNKTNKFRWICQEYWFAIHLLLLIYKKQFQPF